jgi:hypothetical protein
MHGTYIADLRVVLTQLGGQTALGALFNFSREQSSSI